MKIFGSVCLKHPELKGERYAESCKSGYTPSGCTKCAKERVTRQYRNRADVRERIRKYQKNNKDKIFANRKEWRSKNKEEARRRHKKWLESNRDHLLLMREKYAPIRAQWKKKNASLVAAHSAKRRSAKTHATPAWANKFFIEEAYELAKRRSAMKCGGHKWHVDHIVPLRSKVVCGLHVHNNLRVIPSIVNLTKGNRHWPDMPEAA